APETLSGNVGEAYTSTQKTVSGYTFKEVQGSATGTFTDSPQTVTYVYTKDKVAGANVTVKYVDESGNEVSAPETLSGNVGEAYTS
ncbi:MucBP domain-containing protein, partial [Lactococcus garvieae]